MIDGARRPRSLKKVFTASFIGLAVGPLLLFGSLGGWFAFRAALENAVLFEQTRAAEAAHVLRNHLTELESEIRGVARFQDYFSLPRAQRLDALLEIISGQPLLRDLTLVSANGEEIGSVSGVEIQASGAGRNWRDNRLFQAAKTDETVRCGDPFDDPQSGEPVLDMAIPFPDKKTGGVKAVILARIKLRFIRAYLEDYALVPGETLYVCDGAGRIISHPDPSLALSGRKWSPMEGVMFQEDPRGELAVTASAPFEAGGTVFTVTAERTAFKAFAVAIRNALIYLAILVASLAVALALSFLAARVTTEPMDRVTRAAWALGEGDLQTRVEGGGFVELDAMAEAFNGMASRLRESLRGLTVEVGVRKAAEERLALAMDATSDGLWDWNLVTGEVYFSPKYYTMLGYVPYERPSSFDWWRELLRPDVRDGIVETVMRHIDSGEPFELEFPLQTKGGGYKWILGRGKVAALGWDGKPVRMVGTHLDIDERKRTEAELRLWSCVFEHSGWGAALAEDRGARLRLVNPAFAAMHGYAVEELSGRPLALTGGVFQELSPEELADVLAREPILDRESWQRRKDGTLFPALAGVNVLRGEDGGPDVWVINVRDIGALKRTEEALYAAKEQAEAANRAKSAFLANMSHEIRTPLNGVMGMLQLLGRSGLSAEQEEKADFALSSARRLLRLLNDILDFSRIEAGKLVIEEGPFSVRDLLRETLETFRQSALEKGVAIRAVADGSLPESVRADGGRIRQVLFNLAGNAVKFSQNGEIVLEAFGLPGRPERPAGSGAGDGADMRVLFVVSDQGKGIPDALMARLFEPFTQGGDASGEALGAGLGLSIVKRLTHLMGADMCLESEEGKGVNAYFCAPVKRLAGTAAQVPARADDARPGAPAPSPEKKKLRVLVAEDEAINRLSALCMLQKMGHDPVGATDGAQALALLEREGADCVLMDVQMPEIDGLEAVRRLRAHARPELRRLPVAAMTAFAMQGDRERFLAAGMDDYLAKPVEMDELERVVARLALLGSLRGEEE